MQNEKRLYTDPLGFLNFWIGNDGTNYLAQQRSYALVYNGKLVYRGSELSQIVFSPNGKHYGYIIGGGGAIVDGSTKVGAVHFTQLTDLGHFAYWGDKPGSLQFAAYVDGKIVDPVATSAYINEDATHILTGYGNDTSWKLDNKPVQLDNANGGFEFDNNILYVYRLTN